MTSSEIQCSFCGSALPATAIFCKDCGKPLNLLRALHQPTHPPTPQPPYGEAKQMNQEPQNNINPPPANPLQSQPEPNQRQASPLLNQFNYLAQSRASGNESPTGKPYLTPLQSPTRNPAMPAVHAPVPVF